MAQAARLNLRMQKELKLLTSDPPPGVSIPQLSDSENPLSSSLSSIEARKFLHSCSLLLHILLQFSCGTIVFFLLDTDYSF